MNRIEINLTTGERMIVPLTAVEIADVESRASALAETARVHQIKSEIAAIEAGQARAVREAALGDTARLMVIDAAIVKLRAQL